MTPRWLFAAIGLLVALHLAVLVYAVVGSSPARQEGSKVEPAASQLQCRNCGEANQPEYRYCRQCVAELPKQMQTLTDSAGPQSRRTL